MPTGDMRLARKLVADAKPVALCLAGLVVLELLGTPVALLAPIPLQVAVDSVVHGRPVPGFLRWALHGRAGTPESLLIGVCLLSLGIVLVGQVRGLLSSLLSTYTGQNLLLGFRARLFRHAESLSLSYHTDRTSADALYRIQSDAGAIESILTDALISTISSAFTLACMLAVLLHLDFRIGCIALAVSPVLFVLSRASRPVLRGQSRRIKQQESLALAVVQEALGLLRVVKAFGQEDREERRFVGMARQCVTARLQLNALESTLGLAINMVTAGGIALVLYVGVSDVLSHAITLGQLLLILSYVGDLYSPLKIISRKLVAVQSQLASLERAYTFLEEPDDVPEKPGALPLRRAEGRVAFRSVDFGYGPEREVLQGVSFEVEPGTRVGIVGATGAGKTTLVHLLLRLYDPAGGQVLLDGVDLREFRVRDLRRQFAVVFQESLLFSGSIAENIAYGCPGAGRAPIEDAARAANVHEFICSLPEGYDTPVGERGMAVSGGERQRIALARAFLRDAPILVLDEPTSSVDGETEAGILDAMGRLMRGRTTFIIAHRLNTIEGCDVVLKLDEGRLVEVGRPAGARGVAAAGMP